jgi:hypothetical protein
METVNPNDNEFGRKSTLTDTAKRLADLLACVLTDAATDIEVATRDLQTSDASLVRLRRATDGVDCTQFVLEAVSAEKQGLSDGKALEIRSGETVELLPGGAAALNYSRAWLHHPFPAEPDQHAGRSHHV